MVYHNLPLILNFKVLISSSSIQHLGTASMRYRSRRKVRNCKDGLCRKCLYSFVNYHRIDRYCRHSFLHHRSSRLHRLRSHSHQCLRSGRCSSLSHHHRHHMSFRRLLRSHRRHHMSFHRLRLCNKLSKDLVSISKQDHLLLA